VSGDRGRLGPAGPPRRAGRQEHGHTGHGPAFPGRRRPLPHAHQPHRALRRAERTGEAPPPEHGRLWALRLIGLQLSAIYFWAAFDKTDWAFLSGQRLEQTLIWVHSGRPLEEWLLWAPFLVAASVAVVVLEYALAFAIHVRRWLWFVLPIGIMLHAAFYLLLPVDTYSITMVALYLALLDPNAVHRCLDRMQGHAPAAHRL
jgi:hypothetical protein